MTFGPRLSVNVNKVATIRNSRGGSIPSVVEAAAVCLAAGAHGITVHPRADARHITAADVRDLTRAMNGQRPRVEFNIEGDPRPDLLALVEEVLPDQCTLVPVRPGEITSQAGWPPGEHPELRDIVRRLQRAGVRVSLFIDPEVDAARWAAEVGADRIELYTEPYARDCQVSTASGQAGFDRYAAVAEVAHASGLGINAGHDLDLSNLPLFRTLPHLDEVSIGHALVSHALFVGLETAIQDYLSALRP